MAPNTAPESELYRATVALVDHALSPAERAHLKTSLAAHDDLHSYRERRFGERWSETDRAALLEREAEQHRTGCISPSPERSV